MTGTSMRTLVLAVAALLVGAGSFIALQLVGVDGSDASRGGSTAPPATGPTDTAEPTSPSVSPSASAPTPSPEGATGDSEAGSGEDGEAAPQPEQPEQPEQPGQPATTAAYVLASRDGVLRRVDGADTRVSDRRARVAYGVDDLVAYETATPRGADGVVRVWSPREDRRLALGSDATRSRLLGAGALDSRPVALVSELVPGPDPDTRPQDATERLVAVDLIDGARTVYSEGLGAFEEGWTAAHLLPDGDVVAERYASVTAFLVRLDATEGEVWGRETSVDRPNAFAAIGSRLTVVVNLPSTRGARLRLDTYAPADGSRVERQRIRVASGDPRPDRCQDWYDADTLLCGSQDGPVLLSVPGGDAEALDGAPSDGVATAVATTGS